MSNHYIESQDTEYMPRAMDQPQRVTNGVSLAGFVFGCIAVAICFIPIVGAPAIIFGVLAAAFGAIGRSHGDRLFGTAGMILGVTGFIISLAITIGILLNVNDMTKRVENLGVIPGATAPRMPAAPTPEAFPTDLGSDSDFAPDDEQIGRTELTFAEKDPTDVELVFPGQDPFVNMTFGGHMISLTGDGSPNEFDVDYSVDGLSMKQTELGGEWFVHEVEKATFSKASITVTSKSSSGAICQIFVDGVRVHADKGSSTATCTATVKS